MQNAISNIRQLGKGALKYIYFYKYISSGVAKEYVIESKQTLKYEM